MLLFISTSAAKVKIEDCYWYKFEGARSVHAENKQFDVEVANGDKYGLKPITKNKIALLHESETDEVFYIDAKKARSLMGRSKPFKGKINGKKGLVRSAGTQAENKTPRTNAAQPVAYHTVPGSLKEDTRLTNMIRKANVPNADRLTFLARIPMPTGEEYNYYDATEVMQAFQDAGKERTWEDELEKAVVAVTKTRNYVIGATHVDFQGRRTPVLILVE